MESEISDYDEDVILPNSPLSQYMHNFETFDDNLLNEYENLSIKNNHENFQKTSSICIKFSRHMYRILDGIKLYLSYIYSIFVPSLIPFEHSDLKLVLEEAKHSKVLILDDLSILLNFECEDEFYGELPLSYVSVFQQFSHLLGYIMIFLILKSTTATNVIKDDYLLSFFPDKLYFIYILLETFSWIVSKLLYLNIFIIVAFIFKNIVELFLCKFLCYSFRKKLHTTEGITIILKKCIRLIQEAELIARGFTSASIPGIVERLELSTGLPLHSPQRQYPELRKCVFIWSKEMFSFYRSATQKLIEKKFGPVLDFSSQSLAMLDLKEFGSLCCDIDSDTDFQELLRVTDDLSISSLKTMYLLTELQISEFYKYLYLITSFLVSDDNLFNCTTKINHFWNLNSSIRYLQNEQLCVWEQASKMYKYYRSVETLSDPDDKTMTSKKPNQSPLEINVHNMSLHLKAALRRLTDLEELFENSKISDEPNNQKLLKKVEDLTKEIKSEIVAYEEYYQKCSTELQHALYGVKESPIDSLPQEKTFVKGDTVKTTIFTCDAEQEIEDEIFEAIASKSLLENEDFHDTFPVEQQKNNEVAGKLMHELKNVLIIKADEHRLREEKALARKFNNEGLSLIINSNQTNIDCNAHEEESETSSESEEILKLPVHSSSISQNDFQSIISENIETDISTSFKGVFDAKNSFAASITALARQRQEMLGILDDTCFSDGSYSDDEDCS